MNTKIILSDDILGMKVNVLSFSQVVENIMDLAETHRGHYVCVANVHMCYEARKDLSYQHMINESCLTVPDGRPLFWALKLLGNRQAEQTRGTDLVLALCAKAQEKKWAVSFYGGHPATITRLVNQLQKIYPSLSIGCAISPPFRELSSEEQNSFIDQINQAKTHILFVGLGCPKQEKWMAKHKGSLNCMMLGVGAAFDFIAGDKKQAPRVLQRMGLEWVFRFVCDPMRLWKRYLTYNPRFALYLLRLSLKKVIRR